jgi:hypothetical protein
VTNIPSSWKYVGCYEDVPGHTLGPYTVDGVTYDQGQFLYLQGANATNGGCFAACSAQGYPYAGTQYYFQCECSYAINAAATINEDGCSTPSDDAPFYEACGSPNYVSVYTNGGTYTFPAPVADDNLPAPWTYKGCYTNRHEDGATLQGRPDDSYIVLGPDLDASTCMTACSNGDFALAGLEANVCSCGNTINPLSVKTDNCYTHCPANNEKLVVRIRR